MLDIDDGEVGDARGLDVQDSDGHLLTMMMASSSRSHSPSGVEMLGPESVRRATVFLPF
jgi:hypothetical protein